jgi:hypothetical protein
MGGFTATHDLDESVSVSFGAMLPNTFAQGPRLVFGECPSDVFLDADFKSAAYLATAHSDTDVLLISDGVSDTVDSMFGVLSTASFWGGISHFHNNIIRKWQ